MAEHNLPGRLGDALARLSTREAEHDSVHEKHTHEHYSRRARERANTDNMPLSTGAAGPTERGNHP